MLPSVSASAATSTAPVANCCGQSQAKGYHRGNALFPLRPAFLQPFPHTANPRMRLGPSAAAAAAATQRRPSTHARTDARTAWPARFSNTHGKRSRTPPARQPTREPLCATLCSPSLSGFRGLLGGRARRLCWLVTVPRQLARGARSGARPRELGQSPLPPPPRPQSPLYTHSRTVVSALLCALLRLLPFLPSPARATPELEREPAN